MTARTKLLLIFFMLSFYGFQIWHTVYNEVNWPFCSHNFYYHRSPLVKDLFRIVIEDNKGTQFSIDPRHTLPIEGYRCGSIFKEIFIKNSDLEKKQIFSKLLLERLNQGGWKGFDERFAPALPMPGKTFVELQIEKHWVDTRDYPKTHHLPIVKKEIVYRYKK